MNAVAKRLSDLVREIDTVARIGGDEFAVILSNIKDKEGIQRVLNKIISVFSAPLIIDPEEISITLSVGHAIFPDDATNMHKLIAIADEAMYATKRNEKESGEEGEEN